MIESKNKADFYKGVSKMRQIAVFLTLSHSRAIREMLVEHGFVVYKENFLSREILLIDGDQNVFFLDNDERYNGFVCLYNGDSGLEEMGIDRLKLEKDAAVRKIREELDKSRAISVP